TQPTANVSISLSTSDNTEGTVSPVSLTFTSADWATPQTVTVTGVDDPVVDGNVAYTIVTDPASSSDPNYNTLNAADVSVTNNDNDAPAGAVTFEENRTGIASSSSTLSTATNLTAASGHLYLAAISTRPRVSVASLAGLGLSWTRLASQCAGRNQTGVEVWAAQGSPSASGIVTASLAGTPTNSVISVSRYSGVAAVNPVGNLLSGNTLGVNGACSGGVDSAAYSFNLTTTVPGAVAFGAASMRFRTNTPGAGYTERSEILQGAGGDAVSVALEDRLVASASTLAVNGTFSGAVDWAVIILEIKP
ncbi:MAG TPA: hypothetical protein VI755_03810, partial [Anaerolineales bacterium]|nr:hypothetical protein [Anaerolineales bacterium]